MLSYFQISEPFILVRSSALRKNPRYLRISQIYVSYGNKTGTHKVFLFRIKASEVCITQ